MLTRLCIIVLAFSIPSCVLFAGGRGREALGPPETEEDREITLYLAGRTGESPGALRQRLLGPSAGAFMFTEFGSADGAVRLITDREFGMKIVQQSGPLYTAGKGAGGQNFSHLPVYRFDLEMTTPSPFTYRIYGTFEVSFEFSELVSGAGTGARVPFQPAVKALLKGVEKSGLTSGVARIKTMELDDDWVFRAQVETGIKYQE